MSSPHWPKILIPTDLENNHSFKDRFHECASDALILYSGVDRNGTHTRDRGAFIETVAADDLAARLGDHTIETGMAEHHRKDARRHIDRRKVGREGMFSRDLPEGLVADAAARGSIVGDSSANSYR